MLLLPCSEETGTGEPRDIDRLEAILEFDVTEVEDCGCSFCDEDTSGTLRTLRTR